MVDGSDYRDHTMLAMRQDYDKELVTWKMGSDGLWHGQHGGHREKQTKDLPPAHVPGGDYRQYKQQFVLPQDKPDETTPFGAHHVPGGDYREHLVRPLQQAELATEDHHIPGGDYREHLIEDRRI